MQLPGGDNVGAPIQCLPVLAPTRASHRAHADLNDILDPGHCSGAAHIAAQAVAFAIDLVAPVYMGIDL